MQRSGDNERRDEKGRKEYGNKGERRPGRDLSAFSFVLPRIPRHTNLAHGTSRRQSLVGLALKSFLSWDKGDVSGDKGAILWDKRAAP